MYEIKLANTCKAHGIKKTTNKCWLWLSYFSSRGMMFYLVQFYIVFNTCWANMFTLVSLFFLNFKPFFLLNKFKHHFVFPIRNIFYLWTYSSLLSKSKGYGFLCQKFAHFLLSLFLRIMSVSVYLHLSFLILIIALGLITFYTLLCMRSLHFLCISLYVQII